MSFYLQIIRAENWSFCKPSGLFLQAATTTGIQFDLDTPQGKLIAGIMATLAEFERDLVRERVRSGLAAAKAKGKKLGRQPGQRIKSDHLAPKVLQMVEQGISYRQIARELHLSKTTVNEIVKRHRQSKQ